MLQAYSDNLDIKVLENQPIPFTSLAIQKGCTSTKTDLTTFSLNKAGVYMVSFDGIISNSDATPSIAQLFVDGVAQAQAKTSELSTALEDKKAIGFTTLVSVSENNSCRCCDKGVTIQLVNVGSVVIYDHVNLVITKIC